LRRRSVRARVCETSDDRGPNASFSAATHHARQARLERTSAFADRQLIRYVGGGSAPFHDTRDLVDAEHRIQNPKPGDSHQFNNFL
jgi:hypothetical protein